MTDTIETLMREYLLLLDRIPAVFPCKGCHQCCGPITWGNIEDRLIRTYLDDHDMTMPTTTSYDFAKKGFTCPFINDDKCSIYQVRPLICRLQGHSKNLPCPNNKDHIDVSPQQCDQLNRRYDTIRRRYQTLYPDTPILIHPGWDPARLTQPEIQTLRHLFKQGRQQAACHEDQP